MNMNDSSNHDIQKINEKSTCDKNCNNNIDVDEFQYVNPNSNIQRITSKEIDITSVLNSFDNSGNFGATVLFIGTVRNFSDNGKVSGMRYEAYLVMAEEGIKNIEIEVKKKWDVKEIRIINRIGDLKIGDNSIAIAISTPHSKDAFEACQFILNKIKQGIPIWKNERLSDGKTKWVKGKTVKDV
jgi:molybdopterin synthase catalytic subunit